MTKPLQGTLFRKFRNIIMGALTRIKAPKKVSNNLAPQARKPRRHRSVLGVQKNTTKGKSLNGHNDSTNQ